MLSRRVLCGIPAVASVTLIAAAVTLIAAACSDAPTSDATTDEAPVRAAPSLAARAEEEAIDVPEVRIDLPNEPPPWDESDEALVNAVRDSDGYVNIGFKERFTRHARLTGIRGAVDAATVREALSFLRTQGAELLSFRKLFGSVSARIVPELAPELRAHPIIDYVEPKQLLELDGVPMVNAAVPAVQFTNEILTWGAQMVRANNVWNDSVFGYGAKVLIIDNPYHRGHEDSPVVDPLNPLPWR